MQDSRSSKRKWITLILAMLAVVVLYPFKRTVVPAQRVLVTTKDMHPISNALVRQIWQDYSLERYGHEEDLPTDAHGRVTFPPVPSGLLWYGGYWVLWQVSPVKGYMLVLAFTLTCFRWPTKTGKSRPKLCNVNRAKSGTGWGPNCDGGIQQIAEPERR